MIYFNVKERLQECNIRVGNTSFYMFKMATYSVILILKSDFRGLQLFLNLISFIIW